MSKLDFLLVCLMFSSSYMLHESLTREKNSRHKHINTKTTRLKKKGKKENIKKKKKKSLKKKKDEELNDALYPFSQNYKLADYKFGQWPPIIRSRAMLQKDLA
jgi:hypothetical protein